MSKGLNLPDSIHDFSLYAAHVDHMLCKDTTMFTAVTTDSGTVLGSDAAGGILVLTPSDGTVADNDEAYYPTTNEILKIAAGKPIHVRGLVQFTEANTDDANVFFGFMNAIAANTIVDDGAGLKTNFSGAAFFKVDGGLNWKVMYSDGTTQTIAELTASNSLNKIANVAGSASAYQLLEIDVIPKTATLVDIIFKINGSTVYKMTDKTYASATEAQVGCGVKNGGANQQTLNVDAIGWAQKL